MVNIVYFAGEYICPQPEEIRRVSWLLDQQVTIMFIRGIFLAASQIFHISRIHLFGQISDLRCVSDVLE